MTSMTISPDLATSITDAIASRLRSTFSRKAATTATLKNGTVTVGAIASNGRTFTAQFPVEHGVVPIYKASTKAITEAFKRR
jgi:hypothetical protein